MTQKEEGLFQSRLARHLDELRWLYMELYGIRTPAGRPTPTGTAAGSCWA